MILILVKKMGSFPCYESRDKRDYVISGKIINVNIRAEDKDYPRTIKIHDLNTLRKAIQIYQEQINKKNFKIKKAIYEPDQTILPLDKCLNELDINFSGNIIVYL